MSCARQSAAEAAEEGAHTEEEAANLRLRYGAWAEVGVEAGAAREKKKKEKEEGRYRLRLDCSHIKETQWTHCSRVAVVLRLIVLVDSITLRRAGQWDGRGWRARHGCNSNGGDGRVFFGV
jgi:hypothetical protein